MTKLYIVRHGNAISNEKLVYAGHSDYDLTEIGLKQAQTLKTFFKDKKVDKVYSSDLIRAYKTVKVVADMFDLEVITSQNLRELYGGDWEDMKFEDIAKNYPKEFSVWRNEMHKLQIPNGESIVNLAKRVSFEIRKIAEENDGKTVVIGSHGGSIRSFIATELSNFTNTPISLLGWVPNCSITTVEYENGQFKCIEIGNDEHVGSLSTNLPKEV